MELPASALPVNPTQDDRSYWIETMRRIADPVLDALRERKLKQRMPVASGGLNPASRRDWMYLEATGRLLMGMAPWLENGPQTGAEGELRSKYAGLAREAIDAATDPASPDLMNFTHGNQALVDTAFLSMAVLRAPGELWNKLSAATQHNLVAALESTRSLPFGNNNWILFPAAIEAALSMMGRHWEQPRIDHAIRTMDNWYKGDGMYGDGSAFHWDYYNSFVIHPLLLGVMDAAARVSDAWNAFHAPMMERARRYAAIQERLIAPDGSFPPIGRSLCYRFGAFHLLADIALRQQLPHGVSAAQVRCGITAVMKRMMAAPGVVDKHGWLTIGFYGHQQELAENYISTGSSYLCSGAWLPLGLDASNSFWSAPAEPWTAKRIWSGGTAAPDHAIDG
jgi:hypothetical protein